MAFDNILTFTLDGPSDFWILDAAQPDYQLKCTIMAPRGEAGRKLPDSDRVYTEGLYQATHPSLGLQFGPTALPRPPCIIGTAYCKSLTAQTTIAIGDICAIDTVTARSCVLTSGTAEDRWCGVAVTAATLGDLVWLAVLGEATVNCAAAAIAIGDFIDPSPTVGQAHPHPTPTSTVFGIALTSKGTGAGQIQVDLLGKENF